MKNKRIKSMLEAMDEELPRELANEAKVEILLAEISHLQNRLWMSKRDARKSHDKMYSIYKGVLACLDQESVGLNSAELAAKVAINFDK